MLLDIALPCRHFEGNCQVSAQIATKKQLTPLKTPINHLLKWWPKAKSMDHSIIQIYFQAPLIPPKKKCIHKLRQLSSNIFTRVSGSLVPSGGKTTRRTVTCSSVSSWVSQAQPASRRRPVPGRARSGTRASRSLPWSAAPQRAWQELMVTRLKPKKKAYIQVQDADKHKAKYVSLKSLMIE